MADLPGRVLLVTTTNAFEAQVIRARLDAEGIDAHLDGAVDGPYRFAVGAMAEVGVWVRTDDIDDARLVLLAGEVDGALEVAAAGRPRRRGMGLTSLAVVLLTMVLVTLARLAQAG